MSGWVGRVRCGGEEGCVVWCSPGEEKTGTDVSKAADLVVRVEVKYGPSEGIGPYV